MAEPAQLSTDPIIKGFNNARLKAGSPAIEAGNGLALFFIAHSPVDGTSTTQTLLTCPG